MTGVVPACVAKAASAYGVGRPAIEAVIAKPAGAGGIGPMHVPAAWLPILARIGFPAGKVKGDKCTNISAGAWILAFESLHKSKPTPTPAQSSGAIAPNTSERVAALAKHAGVPRVCIKRAAAHYHLSLSLFAGVLATEGGRVGEVHRNENGSVDLGPAQVNSIWLPKLKRAGITRTMLLKNGCANIAVGAWILAQAMEGANPTDPAGFWKHVGDYNSHTPRFNRRYARLVWHHVVQERR